MCTNAFQGMGQYVGHGARANMPISHGTPNQTGIDTGGPTRTPVAPAPSPTYVYVDVNMRWVITICEASDDNLDVRWDPRINDNATMKIMLKNTMLRTMWWDMTVVTSLMGCDVICDIAVIWQLWHHCDITVVTSLWYDSCAIVVIWQLWHHCDMTVVTSCDMTVVTSCDMTVVTSLWYDRCDITVIWQLWHHCDMTVVTTLRYDSYDSLMSCDDSCYITVIWQLWHHMSCDVFKRWDSYIKTRSSASCLKCGRLTSTLIIY